MPGNDAEELAKMPLLYQHFQEHVQSGDVLCLPDFIREHFGSSSAVNQEHQKLPFVKHAQPCLVFVLPAFLFSPVAPAFSDLPPASFPDLVPSLLSACIEAWQPPQLA